MGFWLFAAVCGNLAEVLGAGRDGSSGAAFLGALVGAALGVVVVIRKTAKG